METRSKARSSRTSEGEVRAEAVSASNVEAPVQGSGGVANLEAARFTPFGPPVPPRARNLALSRAYSLDRGQLAAQVPPGSSNPSPAVGDSLVWDGLGLPIPQDPTGPSPLLDLHSNSGQASLHHRSEHSDHGDGFDFDLYVTSAAFASELKRLHKTLEASTLRMHDSIMSQLPHFIDAAESRVTESVLNKVAVDYNRVAIACVESRSRCRSDLAAVSTHVSEAANANFSMAQQLSELSDKLKSDLAAASSQSGDLKGEIEILKSSSATMPSRQDMVQLRESVTSQLADVNAQIAVLRGDIEALKSSLATMPSGPDITELNESIRALSLRLGNIESGQQGVGDSRGLQSQNVPNLNHQSSANPVDVPRINQMSHPGSNRTDNDRPPLQSMQSEEGQDSQRSGSSSYPGDPSARLARLKRKVRICADLIRAIVNQDLSSVTTKAQVLELVNYDLKKLEDLKKTFTQLERSWEAFDDPDEEIAVLFDDTYFSVVGWEHSLIDLKRKFYMHLQANQSLLKNVNLSPFTGSPDSDTVYQFLDIFHRLTSSGCNPDEQADLLYTNYLSPEIQAEVFSFKGSLARMEEWLIQQHGDLRSIADHRMRRISSMKHPQPGQSYKVQADYYKAVMQLVLHVESLASNDRVDQAEVASIIFNSSWVSQLISRLPEDILLAFTKLIENEPRVPPPTGKRYFEIMRNLIDSTWRQLNSASRIKLSREGGPPPDSRKQTRLANVATDHSSGGHSFPCPMHTSKSNHELGHCTTFFKGTNSQRMELCKQSKACFSCFKTECIKVSQRACITSNLPKDLVCAGCAQASPRRPLSVLLCTNQNHTKPSLKALQEALTVYLKSFNVKLIDHLKQHFNISHKVGQKKPTRSANHTQQQSKSSPVQPSHQVPVFDTTSGQSVTNPRVVKAESDEDTCYVFQLIQVGAEPALVFYDSGATSNLVLGSFAERAGFKVLDTENQLIGALGSTTLWTEYGLYSAVLGSEESGLYYHLTFQGISQITSRFPRYDWSTVIPEVKGMGMLNSNETLPPYVGGRSTDILIGLKTPELLPRLLFSLPSGLGVYRCQFRDVFGSRIAFGGPHSVISRINRRFHNFSVNRMTVFLTQMVSSYLESPWLGIDTSLPSRKPPLSLRPSEFQSVHFETTPLSGEDLFLSQPSSETEPVSLEICAPCSLLEDSPGLLHSCATLPKPATEISSSSQRCCTSESPSLGRLSSSIGKGKMLPEGVTTLDLANKAKIPLAKLKQIMEDDREPIVSYRCPSCEDCPNCRSSPILQTTSLRARTEQKLIEASVRISYDEAKVFVKLPFLQDPIPFFQKHFGSSGSNYNQARLTFLQQCKKNSEEKEGIRSEMNKLLDAGFVSPLVDLPAEIRALVDSAPVKHFFPWRSVSKPDSKSTPTRLVVDPSMSMLNLILAKGDPQLSSMFSILLRSRSAPCLWSSDVKKLYNMLFLEKECLPYSLFLYNPSLDSSEEPQVFVLLRAWYGVASTAAQATYALRKLGHDHIESHPLGSKVLLSDSYVDDLLAATQTKAESDEQVCQVNEILAKGGMSLKFVAHSGEAPPEVASLDSHSMSILGYRYLPEPDLMTLNLSEINFNKKHRGAKPPNSEPCTTPSAVEDLILALPKLTRRHVVAKVAEFFDPLGIFEPFKAHLKRALTALNSLDWNEEIPESERHFWVSNLKLWPELSMLKAPRTVVPTDAAIPLQARIICNTDASQSCGGACVYLSFKLQSGEWSSRLLAAKSKLMTFSVPRNELDAVLLGVELCFAVAVSLKLPLLNVIIASDSLVAVSWAMNDHARNKTFVFNRVLAINRYLRWIKDLLPLASVELVHVNGLDNAADCLTKGFVSPQEIDISSPWQNGLPWMAKEVEDMPLTRFSDISLSRDDVARFLEETIATDLLVLPGIPGSELRTNFCIYPTFSCMGESTACVVRPQIAKSLAPTAKSLSSFFPAFLEGAQSLLEKENMAFKRVGSGITHLIDVVHFGWKRSSRILAKVSEFGVKLFHMTHVKTRSEPVKKSMAARCLYCMIESHTLQDQGHANSDSVGASGSPPVSSAESEQQTFSNQRQIFNAAIQLIQDQYWNLRATLLCKSRLAAKELTYFQEDPNTGVLFYKGRLGSDAKISVLDLDLLNLDFLDGKEIRFCNPCIMPDCTIFYAYALHVHLVTLPHAGVESTLMEIFKRFYPIRPRKILTKILSTCIKCKILQKKVLAHEMAEHKAFRTTLAPPFSFMMCDLAQNFMVKTRFAGRQTMKAPALVICCLLSGATAIYMLEDWSVTSVVQALERHSCRYGVPSQIFIDAGSQLRKLSSASYSILDLSNSVRNRFLCEVIQAPPKSHSSQGRVERRIGLIKDMLEKLSLTGLLLSFLNWETLFSKIANDLNNLPIARPSATSQVRPEWSVITPNRLLLGRNNKRSLSGPLIIDPTPSNLLARLSAAQEEWYKLFLKQLHLFVPKAKWYNGDEVCVGDIVMFFIEESPLKKRSMHWHYGIVTAIDGLRLTLEYTIPPSLTRKSLQRSKRDVVRIASEEELDFNSESHFLRLMS